MAHEIVSALGVALLVFGVFVFVTAVLGLFRFHSALTRMHAAAVADALGIFCVLAGLMLLHGWTLSTVKTLLIFAFLWVTSPVASHLIAEMETVRNTHISAECREEHR